MFALSRCLPRTSPLRTCLYEIVVLARLMHTKVLIEIKDIKKGLRKLAGLLFPPQHAVLQIREAYDKLTNGRPRNRDIESPS